MTSTKSPQLNVKYYIKNIDNNKYIDAIEDMYVFVNSLEEVSQCYYFSKREAIEELEDMLEQDIKGKYIIEEIFEI